MNTFQVTNTRGITFTVRIVKEGEKYGLNNCLTHDEREPLIELYDTRYDHTPFGQFVQRYYADTFATIRFPALALDTDYSDWTLDGDALQRVIGVSLAITSEKK